MCSGSIPGFFPYSFPSFTMTSLQWQQTSQGRSVSDAPPATSATDAKTPWFAVSIGLIGLIAGFGMAKWQNGDLSIGTGTPPTAQAVAVPAPTPQAAPTPPPAGPVPPVDAKTDRIRGDLSKAKVALIEYSDFECPFCKRHFPTMQQVVTTYGDKVAFVYRDFPLSFHQNAHKEAEAGRCVFSLGGNAAFWKYHDYVFDKTTSNGTGFPLDQLPVAAQQAGVDVAKFQSCLNGGTYAKAVDDEENGGSAAGVNGTPGNILVDLKTQKSQLISGAVPFSSFQSAINALLGTDAARAAPSGSRTITMTAELWKFTPNVIRVKQGEDVTLQITGVSGTHGFSVPGLGISETVFQGKTASVKIPTSRAGTFDFSCSIPCGQGHGNMTGQIIVEQ